MNTLRRLAIAFGGRPAVEPGRSATGSRHRRAMAGPEGLEGRALLAAAGQALGAMNPAVIEKLASAAYVWGLAPEFVQRFSTYNTTVAAPINTLDYGGTAAAWDNAASNAGDSSILYINGLIDFNQAPALVLTVPASADNYYVVNYLDDFINTVGSIGTRTTPSDTSTSYLLVGPDSPYAKRRFVEIDGYAYRVLASDTDLNWMLIRIGANTLAGASSPDSIPGVAADVEHGFALNTLAQFQANGNRPVFPTDYQTPAPTLAQEIAAAPYQNTPTSAVEFFHQLGTSLAGNPLPSRSTGLSGTPLKLLPTYVVPQYGATARYVVPSSGQQAALRAFGAIGLSAGGFQVPRNWGPAQLQALQAGFNEGVADLQGLVSGEVAGSSTNDWDFLNSMIGTYPNNPTGYETRAAIVLNGGSANVPLDAVYPKTTQIGGQALDGNDTYSITFVPPSSSSSSSSGSPSVADGTYPPLYPGVGEPPRGFWSVTLYQPDATEVSAPFLSQASVLNTSYSTADTSVLSVDAAADTLTVASPSWGVIEASTPILFGANAAQYGLEPGAVYYVAGAPTAGVDPSTGGTTYTFPVSRQWLQAVSPGGVPIQDSGGPGAIASLQSPTGAGPLTYGVVKPVSQLGSPQLDDGQLALNPDGSLTLWIGPTLPAGAPASNWIPTPSTAYFSTLYPGASSMSTNIELILRMYYPTPGDETPSILPYSRSVPETYIPPAVVQVG